MTCLTLALLGSGVALAARYGDFSMRAGDRRMEPEPGQIRATVREVVYVGQNAALYRLTNSDREGWHRLGKNIARSPRPPV